MNDTSLNSSMDDEDDDFDFYNNPAAQFNKIKQQKEKEAARKMKLLEQQFDDEDSINEIENQKSNDPVVEIDSAVIEITDSQSPKPNNIPDYCYEELPTNRRATRSITKKRGGIRQARIQGTSPKNKGNSKKSSLDKGFEELEQAANKLKAAKHNNIAMTSNDSLLIEDSDEDDESENIVNVKVVWRHGQPYSFPIVKKKDISSIYEFFAKQENVNIENIILIKKDKALSPHCTPLSIEYQVTDILEGGILQNGEKPSNNQQDKNCIEVKVQQKNVKKALLIQLHKSNEMHILAKKVASELGIDVTKLKFNFDGETLDLDETVESLDLEGGECFDLVVLG